MKERLIRNLDLKILAIVFAVILWLIVVNIDDPVKSDTFSGIEVQILNAEELEKQGLCYEVLDGTDIVNVKITARRSVIEEISKENITATADMKDLTQMNTISIKVTSNKSASDLDTIKLSSESVKLEVEPLKKISRRIIVETDGEPAEGYVLGNRSMDLNQVEISGPESVVSKIDTVKAVIDVDEATSNVSASVPIYLYDKDGERIESSRLKMNITNLNINQDVLFSKEVELVYEFKGTPAKGYAATGSIVANCESVVLCGRKTALENLNTLYIRGDELSLDGVDANKTVKLDLEDYIPSNLDFTDKSFDTNVTVTAIIRKEDTEEMTRTKDSVRFNGLPSDKKAELLEDGHYVTGNVIKLELYGLEENLAQINIANVTISVDFSTYMKENNLTELGNGYYQITPTISGLPEGVHIDDEVKLRVRITNR